MRRRFPAFASSNLGAVFKRSFTLVGAMPSSKYLLLLDMNGTICYRSEEPVPGAREDLFVRRKHYYARHGIREFVKTLVDSGSFVVCVYTSMMAHNVRAGLDAILPLSSGIAHVLDRNMNKPDPFAINDWDTVRDMEKVWKHIPGFGPERTVLLDNEARKFGDTPRNGIVVPEFGATEVLKRDATTLTALQAYLLQLAEDAPQDVRIYLTASPFEKGMAVKPRGQLRKPAASADKAAEPLGDLSAALAGLRVKPERPHEEAPTRAASISEVMSIPKGTSLHFVCHEKGKFVMSNVQAGLTVRGTAPQNVRIQAKMDFHLLQTLVGKDKMTVEFDHDQHEKWLQRRVQGAPATEGTTN